MNNKNLKYIKLFLSFAFSLLSFLPKILWKKYKQNELMKRQEFWRQNWLHQFRVQERLIQRKKSNWVEVTLDDNKVHLRPK